MFPRRAGRTQFEHWGDHRRRPTRDANTARRGSPVRPTRRAARYPACCRNRRIRR